MQSPIHKENIYFRETLPLINVEKQIYEENIKLEENQFLLEQIIEWQLK